MSPKNPRPFKPKSNVAKRLCEYFDGENFVEISSKTSISDVQVAACLKGNSKPSVKMLEFIAENGGDVNYILTGKKTASKQPETVINSEFTENQNLLLTRAQTLIGILLDVQKLAISDPSVADKYAEHLQTYSEVLKGLAKAE